MGKPHIRKYIHIPAGYALAPSDTLSPQERYPRLPAGCNVIHIVIVRNLNRPFSRLLPFFSVSKVNSTHQQGENKTEN